MNLHQLAIACWIFGEVLDFDKSYDVFVRATGASPDLTNAKHRQALLKWLNDWGCRQFARNYHGQASEEILTWFRERGHLLPARDKNIWELTDVELDSSTEAYAALSPKIASLRQDITPVCFGPVGAAKILFAVRPTALPPWDTPIYEKLGYDASPKSYRTYLAHMRNVIQELAQECQRHGVVLGELPQRLGRPMSTVAKLIDEYYWVTLTNECDLPEIGTIRQWVKWAES